MCVGWQAQAVVMQSERKRGVCFGPYPIFTSRYALHLLFSSLPPQHLNASTQTARASKMAGRLFTYYKEFVGIDPDSTDTETETDTDSSTSSTRFIYPPDVEMADSPDSEVADSPEPKVAVSHVTKVTDAHEPKVADSPNAKAATDVKQDDNGTATTAANNDDAKVEQVNLDIANGSQQTVTTQAAIEAWYVAELTRLEAKLATSDARLIGLAANLALADCVIFKKEQEHLRLYGKLWSLHEAYSRRHEELTKQNQELERVVEESVPGEEADMALLLLYLSRATVDISGTAKQDAERLLCQADEDWEAYKRSYSLYDKGVTSDAEGAQ